ncbi:MAG: DUF4118 domain-containing protein [Xanthobacteraceae bacterium]
MTGVQQEASDAQSRRPPWRRGLRELMFPALMAMLAVLLTTLVVLLIEHYFAGERLMLAYVLPTIFVAIYFGSTVAVVTAFASALVAAYLLFPPKFSFYIADPVDIGELCFTLVLAVIAARAVGVLAIGAQEKKRSSLHRLR